MDTKCFKYRFCFWKARFGKGYGLTSYIKYIIILFGLAEGFATQSLDKTLIAAFIYGIACFFIGYVWYKYGFVEAEIEVSNQYNLFVKELRSDRKKRKV